MHTLRLVFLLSLVLLAAGANDLIGNVCHNTPNINLCEATLRSDPRSSGADTQGLVQIITDTVKSRFADSLSYVNGQMRMSPPAAQGALRLCARLFGAVLSDDVPEAESAAKLGDPKFGESAMADAAVEADACQRALAGGSYRSELIGRTNYLRVLSNVAASMFRAMAGVAWCMATSLYSK